jgi:hypothetical protein
MLEQIGAGFIGEQIGHKKAPNGAPAREDEALRFLALLSRFSQGKRRELRP